MHDTSAGKIKSSPVTLDHYLKSIKSIKSKTLQCPTPRPSEFNLDLIIPKNSENSFQRPPRLLSTCNSLSTPTHRRQPSIMIRNISEIYSFTQDNTSCNSISEDEIGKSIKIQPRNSLFESTNDAKSQYNSLLRKSYSDIEEEYVESENSEIADIYNGVTKPDENFSTLGLNTQEGNQDFSIIGNLPSKIYCKYCELETTTDVSIIMPTLPF